MYRIELAYFDGTIEPRSMFGMLDSLQLYVEIEEQLAHHQLIYIDVAGVSLEAGAHVGLCDLVLDFGPEILDRIILVDTSGHEQPELQEVRHAMCQHIDWLAYWAGEFKEIPCPKPKPRELP